MPSIEAAVGRAPVTAHGGSSGTPADPGYDPAARAQPPASSPLRGPAQGLVGSARHRTHRGRRVLGPCPPRRNGHPGP
ncbi:hypothetical protein [Frankia sp. EAN1pec]|uniref:hypothetical protein n=1 Tax=Parafrankia sp. (strain EAN1pec) TaxID=298653 RepID=UPI0002F457BF